MLDRHQPKEGLPIDPPSGFQEKIQRVLDHIKTASLDERLHLLQSDLSPRPINKWHAKGIHGLAELRPIGPYLYGLFLSSDEQALHLRTYPHQNEVETKRRMLSEAEETGETLLRQGELFVNWSDVMERNVGFSVGKETDQAMRVLMEVNFQDYEYRRLRHLGRGYYEMSIGSESRGFSGVG